MEGSAYIGSAAAGLVYFVLGARLVRLGIRTRSAAEWLLGLTFLIWALSYALWVFAIALQDQPALESQFLIASRLATNLGGVGIAFFPLLAFRRGSTWAKWLSASIAICLIIGTRGFHGWEIPKASNRLQTSGGGSIGSARSCPRSGSESRGSTITVRARPRVRLGLCEPIVRHRYLLWGLAGGFWTLLDFVVVGQYVEFWATRSWSATLDSSRWILRNRRARNGLARPQQLGALNASRAHLRNESLPRSPSRGAWDEARPHRWKTTPTSAASSYASALREPGSIDSACRRAITRAAHLRVTPASWILRVLAVPLAISRRVSVPTLHHRTFPHRCGDHRPLLFIRLVFDSRFATVHWSWACQRRCGARSRGLRVDGRLGGNLSTPEPLVVVEWASITVSVAWIGVESTTTMAKLRSQFGLCGAMTGNRFLVGPHRRVLDGLRIGVSNPADRIRCARVVLCHDGIVRGIGSGHLLWLIFFRSHQLPALDRPQSIRTANPEKSRIPADLR